MRRVSPHKAPWGRACECRTIPDFPTRTTQASKLNEGGLASGDAYLFRQYVALNFDAWFTTLLVRLPFASMCRSRGHNASAPFDLSARIFLAEFTSRNPWGETETYKNTERHGNPMHVIYKTWRLELAPFRSTNRITDLVTGEASFSSPPRPSGR
jgi:hypothetical protein